MLSNLLLHLTDFIIALNLDVLKNKHHHVSDTKSKFYLCYFSYIKKTDAAKSEKKLFECLCCVKLENCFRKKKKKFCFSKLILQ